MNATADIKFKKGDTVIYTNDKGRRLIARIVRIEDAKTVLPFLRLESKGGERGWCGFSDVVIASPELINAVEYENQINDEKFQLVEKIKWAIYNNFNSLSVSQLNEINILLGSRIPN